MSAMLMSVMMRSYGPRGSSLMASNPHDASTTWQPPKGPANVSSSRAARTNALADAESSTTSTFRIAQSYYGSVLSSPHDGTCRAQDGGDAHHRQRAPLRQSRGRQPGRARARV